MAAKKTTKLGFDPLVWMNEEKETDPLPEKKAAVRSRKPTHPLGFNVPALEKSYTLLKPLLNEIAVQFYEKLFSRHPEMKTFFKGINQKEQQTVLVDAINRMVGNLNSTDVLQKTLDEFAVRHHAEGVTADHYAAVASILTEAMEGVLGKAVWTKEFNASWDHALGAFVEHLLESQGNLEAKNMAVTSKGMSGLTNHESELDEAAVIDMKGRLAAIDKTQATIEFELDGTILTANDNFLKTVGYTLDEIRGKHHRMFVDAIYERSPEYRQFWDKLGRGEYDEGQYKRIAKGGREVWLQASYNPILDPDGNPFKVVKYATDITEDKFRQADTEGQLAAVSKSQATIEFNLDGTIVTANDNFLNTVGYSMEEIRGKHHRLFVEPSMAQSQEYRQFWERLGRGEYDEGQYKRIAKDGHEVWLQASYNPILDPDGKPFKVVKYATDITENKIRQADAEGQLAAVSKSQATIEFNLDGTIVTANDNFLNAVGYSMEEIRGKHHRLFVEPEYERSAEYRQFWDKLGHGEYDEGQYKRIAKGGREVWLQASYNPILDPDGKPFKVVKYATDITKQKEDEVELQEVMSETTEVMNFLSAGDLNHQMMGEYSDKFTQLKNAINDSIGNLFNMVNEIRTASVNMSSGASEIAQGNADLSQRTEEQASSLEETASSMEEMTSTVKQNADNARQANQLAGDARVQAEGGGQVVQKAVGAMSEINKSSKKISDIISVIDEIAFQTNLLALNAAVEAARAGEQGRGFAVVAGEVRNLAQRSAGAAKEIKSLINDSVDKVEEGTKLVDESGSTLDEIVKAVGKVSDIIAEIATAGQEQSSGIEQVNKAVMQMDEMTQQNAALVEEAASASESMEEQAKGLIKLMEFFTVDDDGQDDNYRSAPAKPTVARRPAPNAAGRKPASRPRPRASGDEEWNEF